MELLGYTAGYFLVSMLAGTFGALLGLGGGLIVVPALTLGFGLEIRYAIGASMVCLIATSCGAAAAYVRDKLTNIRVAMFLETGTALGALVGALIAGLVSSRVLFLLFSFFMLLSSAAVFRKHGKSDTADLKQDPLAERLALHGETHSQQKGDRPYKVHGTIAGWAVMVVAGIASGLLGIGSGSLKVPAMDLLMRLPIKVSSATSNFMIGVTASTGAVIYFVRGDVLPEVAGPVAIGVMAGSYLGAKLLTKTKSSWLRSVLFVALCLVAVQMFLKGVL